MGMIGSIGFGVNSIEIRLGVIAERSWGWNIEIVGLYLGAVFGLQVPFCMLASYLAKRIQFRDRVGALVGIVVATMALILLFGYGNLNVVPQVALWTLGGFMFSGSLCIGRGYIWSLTSKILPPRQLSKGLSYSFLLFTLARGIGSVYGTYLTIENTNAFAAGLLALFVLNILAASLSYDKLLPLKDKENKRA